MTYLQKHDVFWFGALFQKLTLNIKIHSSKSVEIPMGDTGFMYCIDEKVLLTLMSLFT